MIEANLREQVIAQVRNNPATHRFFHLIHGILMKEIGLGPGSVDLNEEGMENLTILLMATVLTSRRELLKMSNVVNPVQQSQSELPPSTVIASIIK